MSKNVKGVLGNQVGKVGPVVARKFRDLNVYSAYQPNVKNPRTEKQQLNRLRFAELSRLAHGFGCAVLLGFMDAVRGTSMTMRNMFTCLNAPMVKVTGLNSVDIDFTGITIAKGGLCPVHFGTLQFDTPLEVDVNWDDLNGANECQRTANDKVYVVVYSPDAGLAVVGAGVPRTTGIAKVVVPSNWNGTRVHVYGFVRNDGPANEQFSIAAGECSDSIYLGSGTIG